MGAFCLLTLLGLAPANAFATLHLFSIDPASSSLALQGSTGQGIWQEQATGSLTAAFSGWLVLDIQAASIQIVSGGAMVAMQTNSWQPGPSGSIPPQPASYGGQTTVGSGIARTSVVLAVRNLSFDLLSSPVTIGGGPLDASSVSLSTAASPKPVLDFRANGLVIVGGSRPLDGLSATNAPGSMTFGIATEVQTLTLPVDISFTSQVLASNDTTLHFTGMVVARRGLTIINRQLLWLPSPTNGPEFTLIWDGSLNLQQATVLSPPNWTTFSTNPPALILPTNPAAFFEVGGP